MQDESADTGPHDFPAGMVESGVDARKGTMQMEHGAPRLANDGRNDGKQLERLIGLIEHWLLPNGFEITPRHPVIDDDGRQIAEFDILITGKFGSASLQFLIECRDRPSEGPAPTSWIEQLVGRRERFKLDKVMAVSTTGFAPDAKKFADSKGIELRMLDKLTHEAISNWLPMNAPLVVRDWSLQQVQVGLPVEDSQGTRQAVPFGADEPRFRNRDTGEASTLRQIWQQVFNDNDIWKNVPCDGLPKPMTIKVSPTVLDKLVFRLDDAELNIGYIEFSAILTVTIPTMPLVTAAQYISQPVDPDRQETFVKLGHWKGADTDPIKEMIVLGIPKKSDESGSPH